MRNEVIESSQRRLALRSTNYFNFFTSVASDSKAMEGLEPGARATTARHMFQMIHDSPYRYTSDDVIYAAHVQAKGPHALARDEFFSKSQACLRSSALAKTFGWGIHFDTTGHIALYGVESSQYRAYAKDLPVKAALRSRRA